MLALGLAFPPVVYLIAKMASGGVLVRRDTTPVVPPPGPGPVPPFEPPAPTPPAPVEPTTPVDEDEEEPPAPPVPTPAPPVDEDPTLPTPEPPGPVTPPPAPLPSPPVPLPPEPKPIEETPPVVPDGYPPVDEDEEEPPAPPQPTPEPPVDEAPEDLPTPPTPTPQPPVPTPTPPAPTPEPEVGPSDETPPQGFNPSRARALAPQVAKDVREKQHDYPRARMKEFQLAAGVAADGIYGGETRGALVHYVGPDAPAALYKPTKTEPYRWADEAGQGQQAEPDEPAPTPQPVPPAPPPDDDGGELEQPEPTTGPTPPAGYDPAKAKRMAKQVASNLDSKGRSGYDRALLKQFQLAAGIDADGIYGGQSRGALIHYGVPRPPQAYFKPVATEPYMWADYDGGAP